MRTRRGAVAGLCLVGFVLAITAAPAQAWSTTFDYACYTRYVVGDHQGDRRSFGNWYTSVPGGYQIQSTARSYGAPSWYSNNACGSSSVYLVEVSDWQRPLVGTQFQPYCSITWSGQVASPASVTAGCTDNYSWTSMRVEMGHRWWFTGSYYDDYPVAGLVP